MKIAVVLDSVAVGGAERQAIYSARELARDGCDVELIYYRRTVDHYDLSSLYEAKVTYVPRGPTPVHLIWRLWRHLRMRSFDVVYSLKDTPCVYGGLAGWLAGAPVVLGGYRNQYKGRGLIRLGHRLANAVNAGWIVNSDAIARSMITALGVPRERIHVVHNGIDCDIFASGLDSAEAKRELGVDPTCHAVTIIGRLHPEKNHEMFLDMAAQVYEKDRRARFVIAGDGDRRAALEERMRELRLEDTVLFLGNRSDIPRVLAASDVVVLTSPAEGLSNALLEAMAAGIPVISTAYPGVEDLITDGLNGLIVACGDVRSMAASVLRLSGDPGLRSKMGQEGRQTARLRFDVGVMAANLRAVFERCLSSARQQRA